MTRHMTKDEKIMTGHVTKDELMRVSVNTLHSDLPYTHLNARRAKSFVHMLLDKTYFKLSF